MPFIVHTVCILLSVCPPNIMLILLASLTFSEIFDLLYVFPFAISNCCKCENV